VVLRRRVSARRQPAPIGARDLLINHAASTGGQELRRLAVTRGGAAQILPNRGATLQNEHRGQAP